MCDYSRHSVRTRPARVGDKLVTSEFNRTTTESTAQRREASLLGKI